MNKLFKELKRGTSMDSTIFYVPRTGTLQNLIGCTAYSKVKDAAGRRHTLTCTIAEDGLSIQVVAPPSVTKDFSVGTAYWDVGIETNNGSVLPTATWQFEVTDFISDKTR